MLHVVGGDGPDHGHGRCGHGDGHRAARTLDHERKSRRPSGPIPVPIASTIKAGGGRRCSGPGGGPAALALSQRSSGRRDVGAPMLVGQRHLRTAASCGRDDGVPSRGRRGEGGGVIWGGKPTHLHDAGACQHHATGPHIFVSLGALGHGLRGMYSGNNRMGATARPAFHTHVHCCDADAPSGALAARTARHHRAPCQPRHHCLPLPRPRRRPSMQPVSRPRTLACGHRGRRRCQAACSHALCPFPPPPPAPPPVPRLLTGRELTAKGPPPHRPPSAR